MKKSELMGIEAVVFDMDGVLLDTEAVCKKCWRLAARDFGLEKVDDVFFKCVGQARQDTLSTLSVFFKPQNPKFDAQEFYDATLDYFYKIESSEGLEKKKFASECLASLKNAGFRLALASSTRRVNVVRQLKAAGILDFFSTLTCGDSVAHSKPDPEIYLKACDSLSLPPEKCAAVEDSENGVKSAYAAGLKVVMVPDLIQPSLLVKKMCWKIEESLEAFVFG